MDPTLVGPTRISTLSRLLAFEAIAGERACTGTNLTVLAEQHIDEPLRRSADLRSCTPCSHARPRRSRRIAFPMLTVHARASRGRGLVSDVEEHAPALDAELAGAWIADAPHRSPRRSPVAAARTPTARIRAHDAARRRRVRALARHPRARVSLAARPAAMTGGCRCSSRAPPSHAAIEWLGRSRGRDLPRFGGGAPSCGRFRSSPLGPPIRGGRRRCTSLCATMRRSSMRDRRRTRGAQMASLATVARAARLVARLRDGSSCRGRDRAVDGFARRRPRRPAHTRARNRHRRARWGWRPGRSARATGRDRSTDGRRARGAVPVLRALARRSAPVRRASPWVRT